MTDQLSRNRGNLSQLIGGFYLNMINKNEQTKYLFVCS